MGEDRDKSCFYYLVQQCSSSTVIVNFVEGAGKTDTLYEDFQNYVRRSTPNWKSRRRRPGRSTLTATDSGQNTSLKMLWDQFNRVTTKVKLIRSSPVVWLFVLLLGLYLLTMGGRLFISDGVAMYMTTRAIVLEQTIAVPADKELPQLIVGHGGRIYSPYDIGQPLLAIPFYLLGWFAAALNPNAGERLVTEFAVSTLPQVATALAGAILYRLCYAIYGKVRIAIAISLLWGTGTLAWPYALVYFSESVLTLFLLLSWYFLVISDMRRNSFPLLYAGIAFGIAVITRVGALVYLPPTLIYLAFSGINRHRYWRNGALAMPAHRLLWFVAGFLPLLLIFLWHNAVRFGRIWQTGYEGMSFSTPLQVGIYGLLFSPGRSLFLYSPLVGLGLAASLTFLRRYPKLGLYIGSLFATALVFYGKWWAWYGGWSWGPRFLVPLIPMLLLPIGVYWGSRPFRILVLATWLLSLFVVLPGVLVDFNIYIIETLQGDYARESLLWFTPQYSPLLGHWRYLLAGQELALVGYRLSDFGLPGILNRLFLPLVGLLCAASMVHLITIYRRQEAM